MNIAVSVPYRPTFSSVAQQMEAERQERLRRRQANAIRPKLVTKVLTEVTQPEQEPAKIGPTVLVEHDWVKQWKAREAEALKDVEIVPLAHPTIEEIQLFCVKQKWTDSQRTVPENYISVRELKSNRRLKDIVLVRHAAFYLCSQLTPRSYPEIAKKFGGKDHTSVLYGVRRIEERLKDNELLMNGEPFNLERIGEI